jgi:adenine-specific DNA-methyltransferase
LYDSEYWTGPTLNAGFNGLVLTTTLDMPHEHILSPTHSTSQKGIKRELGQFLTPAPVADFMASLFSGTRREWRLLDAGAGAGALSAALMTRICESAESATSIRVTAYELDASLIPKLRHEYEQIQRKCGRRGIDFSANILNADFIECASEAVRRDLFSRHDCMFNSAILNPPYRKINSNSRTRQLLRAAGIETSNLYAGFLALATKLLSTSGELVAITPRSFCNGPYFRPFRQHFLETMSLRQIHVFESRSAAFARDAVLQENVIVHAVKSREKPTSILVSVSSGKPGASVKSMRCNYSEVVAPHDPASFIHLVTDRTEVLFRDQIAGMPATLADLGLSVSTGRVVDFRATQFLRQRADRRTVPLIRPCHFDGGVVQWPATRERKPCAILNIESTRDLLVPRGFYVLVKRFSAKEERRRIVASVYDPSKVRSARVGFENHLNYFHANGQGFDSDMARGLALFLNSTAVDLYFRHFSGHTQVNATDLRSIKYPTRKQIVTLGAKARNVSLDQSTVDNLVRTEFF